MIDPHDTPGFTSALAAVSRAGGVLLSPDAAYRLTVVTLAAADPHIRTDQIIRIADDMEERANNPTPEMASADGAGWLREMAAELRAAGQQIREALQ